MSGSTTPMPLVTVILPTLDASGVLEGCLESMAAFPDTDGLEVLVLDGGSRDGTPALARTFADRLPGLRVVEGKDKGIYDAMNKGMDLATGRWLHFLGADDRWIGAARLAELLRATDGDVDILQVVSRLRGGAGGEACRGVSSGRLLAGEEFNHQAMFYRRSAVEHLRYDLAYRLAADQLFTLRMVAERRARVRHVPEALVDYANTGVSSQRKDDRWHADKAAWIARCFPAEEVARRERWRSRERWIKRIVRLAAGGKASRAALLWLQDRLYG